MVEMMRLGIKRVSDASKSTAISVKAGSITMTMGIVMLNIKFIIKLLNHYPQGVTVLKMGRDCRCTCCTSASLMCCGLFVGITYF